MRAIAGPADLRQLHREHPARYPFLLQSTAHGGVLGRFDILFAFPDDTIVANAENRFLDDLDAAWQRERVPPEHSELPFSGGWFVYLGYELAAQIETGLELHSDPVLPTAFAVRCPAALIYDHAEETCWLVAEHRQEIDSDRVHEDVAALQRDTAATTATLTQITEEPGDRFKSAVISAKDYIAAGDVYQANLSREWSATAPDTVSASDIYDVLCRSNPGPFAGIARWQDTTIISSSPERLLRVRDGIISTRPIAGTRPRSEDVETDDSLSAELFAHPKERAEHIMLIDLERNDLGRVCRAGTVEVNEMMVLESYAHVHHIVSNVRGELHDNVTPGQAIAAVFPGGTITGCPKVRCMEIISELEQAPRGAYTGSFGYLNRDGSLDLNILIRTLVKQDRDVTFRAGSGIVADSDPQAELEETRAKAKGLLRAISG
ncbi:MAG: aminodeoxychorismate synthase component I [Woeseiaceae bacterium]|nr:aminodeoxychorismate synthase component I [Woeseiaceae bacterium]